MDPEIENEEIDVEIVDEEAEPEAELPEGEAPEGEEASEPVLFEDAEESPEVADVAAQLAELKRLRAQVKAAPAAPPAVPQLGKKPKLEDFDFDGPKFEEAIDKWHADKAEVDRVAYAQAQVLQEQQAEFEGKVKQYQASKADLGADDYEAVELRVQDSLDLSQQGILIQGSDHAAQLVYALGRSKTKLAELAKIKNPIKFAFAVAKLESELMSKSKPGKASSKAPKTAPETSKPKGGSTGTGGGSANERRLEQLRAEALKTGDISKVVAFKRQLKSKKAG